MGTGPVTYRIGQNPPIVQWDGGINLGQYYRLGLALFSPGKHYTRKP